MNINELGFSKFVEYLLRDAGITEVHQLMSLTTDELKSLRKVGPKSLREIEEKRTEIRQEIPRT